MLKPKVGQRVFWIAKHVIRAGTYLGQAEDKLFHYIRIDARHMTHIWGKALFCSKKKAIAHELKKIDQYMHTNQLQIQEYEKSSAKLRKTRNILLKRLAEETQK